MINIFLLHPMKVYSGAHTFTYHLARALESSGEQVRVLRTQHWKRPNVKEGVLFPGSTLKVYDIDANSAVGYTGGKTRSIIAFMLDEFADIGCELMREGAPIVIHDRRSYKNFMDDILEIQPRAACIRREVTEAAKTDKLENIQYIPHPYGRFKKGDIKDNDVPQAWAHCLSRIGWEKHIDMLLTANLLLPKDKKIMALGECYDRFAKMKLHGIDEDWEKHLFRHKYGKPSSGFLAASKCRYAVDLSVLGKHGGGGSQYTFLEAMDAGTPLIIHRDWIGENDTMVEGYNCLAVEDAGELVDVLSESYTFNPLRKGYKDTLAEHGYDKIGAEYLKFIKGD